MSNVTFMDLLYNCTASRRALRLGTRHPGIREFIAYFYDNYINGSYPPRMWNVYNRDMDTRSNNHVECK